jgi:hypothetical protein
VALTDDQKAMLRLLAQREEGYEDMAALMGISVEQVRERVKEALAEVDQPPEEPAAPEPEPPPAPPAPQPPAPAPEPAAPIPTPEASAPVAKAPAAKPGGVRRSGPRPSLKMPKDRGALIGLGAGALVVLIFAIVLIVGGGGESGSGSGSTVAEDAQGGTTPTAAENENLTQAILTSTNGSDASGQALFGRFKKSVLLQVKAEGLAPSEKGQSYTVWLYRSPKLALQIGAVPVPDSGKIAAQFQIPAQLLTYVASGAFNQVDISLTSDAEYQAAFAKAKKERQLPPYLGESVLRGEITGPAIKQQ